MENFKDRKTFGVWVPIVSRDLRLTPWAPDERRWEIGYLTYVIILLNFLKSQIH